MASAGRVGRVERRQDSSLGWLVVFPDVEHHAVSSYLRELAASDCSPATIRSYAYALLRWFRPKGCSGPASAADSECSVIDRF